MQLANDVYHYYFTNRNQLSDDKLFHFATRTAAWLGRDESYELLRQSTPYIVQPGRSIYEVVADVYNTPQTGRRNAHELRQPFFEKYPKLYGAHLALFRVRHLQEVYGIDAREALFAAISKEELLKLRDQLLADTDALKILSTFAINFCYLLERVVLKNPTSLPLESFLELGNTYDTSSKEQAQLLMYFYTHCIIGESNFYVKKIPTETLPIYLEMLKRIEPLLEANYTDINLDNKLEFLVCARICGFETPLFDRIYTECHESISHEGTFLVDIHNSNAQEDRNDFVKSEHRNVLFIMSTEPYKPHSTLIS
jgi:hypothetical protein